MTDIPFVVRVVAAANLRLFLLSLSGAAAFSAIILKLLTSFFHQTIYDVCPMDDNQLYDKTILREEEGVSTSTSIR